MNPDLHLTHRTPERISSPVVQGLTRLTYAFSKKWENLGAALALHFAYYNLCRIHRSIRVTPAMASGITDHVWSLAELLA